MRVLGISSVSRRSSSAEGFQMISFGSTGSVALADGLLISPPCTLISNASCGNPYHSQLPYSGQIGFLLVASGNLAAVIYARVRLEKLGSQFEVQSSSFSLPFFNHKDREQAKA